MRCPICNSDTDAPDDCAECQMVIHETVLGYEKLKDEEDEDSILVEY